ncbi:MAG TPA: DUF2490 domain-containing protein [Longimicrobiales bacterium]|nr:DUF2490 domain-containing protein [Longimicrobiales bacterium]
MLPLLFPAMGAAAQTRPASDFQQWTHVDLTYEADSRLKLTAFGEARVGNDVSHLYEERVGAEITYSPWHWLSTGPGYLYAHADPDFTGRSHENRAYADLTFQSPKLHGFLLHDRARGELRWLQRPTGSDLTRRFRNRLRLERPIQTGSRKYTPYVMWEKFYDSAVDAWSRTRYYAGLGVPVGGRASAELYSLHQDDRFSRPFDTNVIGANLTFLLREARSGRPGERSR